MSPEIRALARVGAFVVAFAALLALLWWCDHLGGERGRIWLLHILMVTVAAWCANDTVQR